MSKIKTIFSGISRISRLSRISRISRNFRISRISRISGSLVLLAALFLTGCENDSVEPADNRQRTTVELLSYSTPFLEITPWVTRADPDPDFQFGAGYTDHLPDGYLSYEVLHPHASVDDSTIGVFMTPDDANPSGDFIYQGVDGTPPVSVWKSTIVVEKDKQYYIYGFMPRSGAESATITSLNGTGGTDYANGAVITIDNYDALTTADVSVIVGLRWASENEKINGTKTKDVPLGYFSYVGQDDGENRLFVLLKHIYAGLHFATKLDPTYAALRSIRITKVELTAVGIREKVNLNIRLEANNTGTDPLTSVTYAPASPTASNKTITLYEKTDDPTDAGKNVPADHFEDFLGCLVPGSTTNFVLKTTYDVYDKDTSVNTNGNLIRKNCVAENKINSTLISELTQLQAGQLFTVNLLIQPTFLYVLSEPDLDNPTITIQ